MSNIAQRSFGGGEIAPGLFARTDTLKYQTGLRTCRNFIVQRHGGIVNRPGSDYIQPTKNSGAVRLIKFVLNDEVTYVIELGAFYARFYANGAAVRVAGVSAWTLTAEYEVGDVRSNGGVNYYCLTDHTSAGTDEPGVGMNWPALWSVLTTDILELPTPYALADLPKLNFAQSGERIVLVHPSYAPRELLRIDTQTWTLTTIVFGPSIAPPTNIAATGAGAAGTTYYAVTAIKEGTLEESLVGLYTFAKVVSGANPATLTWDSVDGAISYNVYRSADGKTYGLISSAGGLTATINDTAWTDTNEIASSTDPNTYTPSASALLNALAVSATARAYDGNYRIKVLATLSVNSTLNIGGANGRIGVYYSRDGEGAIFAGYTYVTLPGPREVEITINVPDNVYTTLSITLIPEVQAAVEFPGDLAELEVDAGSAPANVISWQENAVGFIDVGGDPDYATAPPNDPRLFSAIGDYPSTAAYYQQRLFLAASASEPLKVWGSQIGSFYNFGTSTPLMDTDAVSFSLVGPQVNAVRHLVDLGKLLVMTAGGEMKIDGDDAGIIRPDAINPNSLSENGSQASLRPMKIVDSMAYVQARGNIVRSLKPVGAGGSIGGYEGTDLSVFASHLFKGKTLVDWDYSKAPNSILWIVRLDGTLLGLTYLPESGLWGWHRHDTDGVIENVCCVPEGDEDRLYMVVRRTINGSVVRYVERMAQRYFATILDAQFVDAAKVYDGTNTNPASTVLLTTATTWDFDAELSIATGTADPFAVGDTLVLYNDDSAEVRIPITTRTNANLFKGFPNRTVPIELRSITSEWAKAVTSVTGLGHLEGKSVAILGDGYVVASPNNSAYPVAVIVGGAIAFDRAYVHILVGLPYLSDAQTLDLDSASGPSVKDRRLLVNRVGLYVEESRGIWAGKPDTPTDADPLNGLQEYKARDSEAWSVPTDMITSSIEINIESTWDDNGRVLIRQVDPLPLALLSITPIGYI